MPTTCNLEDFEDGTEGSPLPLSEFGPPPGVYTSDAHSGLLAGRVSESEVWLKSVSVPPGVDSLSIWFKVPNAISLEGIVVIGIEATDTSAGQIVAGVQIRGADGPTPIAFDLPADHLGLSFGSVSGGWAGVDLGPVPYGDWLQLRIDFDGVDAVIQVYREDGTSYAPLPRAFAGDVATVRAAAQAFQGTSDDIVIVDDYACNVPPPLPPEPPFVRGSCGCSGGSQALTSYMNLCGNEIVNAARTSRYIQHGLVPNGFSFKCDGCEGLVDILPCLGDEPLAAGYQLPELDNAPWYDPQVPESKNFAGLYVLSATMSAPYSRSVTPNIGVGSSLGRLKLNGRNIVVRGWLVGKTCCSVQYGLKWLTDALGGDPCGSGDCGGCDLDFLRCCPSIGDAEDSCLVTEDEYGHQTIYVRPDSDSEYQRAEDFFARMHNVGVVDGPHVLSCKGGSCGCGCGTILEVEFTLHAGSPYMNSLAEEIFTVDPFPGCEGDDSECPVVWQLGPTCESSARCQEPPDCLEDPKCPAPKLPPAKGRALPLGCGCIPLRTETFCSSIIPQKDWGSSTLNFEVYAGSKPIRNLAIRVFQNPQQRDCGDRDFFDECEACATLIVNYVPAGGTLRFSGEERTVTVTCGAKTRSAARNISGLDELPFDWPDLSCVPMCACVTIDCASTASDASMRIFRVDRSL